MEKGNYICELCNKEYEPTKRGVQRFCSSKCRKKFNYHLKKGKSRLPIKLKNTEIIKVQKQENKIEKMSLSGVGNAFWGGFLANVVTELGKNILSSKELNADGINTNLRYLPVLNLPKGPRNSTAYFDLEKQHLIYVPDQNYFNPADSVI